MVIHRDCSSEHKGEEQKAATEKKKKKKIWERQQRRKGKEERRVENGGAPFVIFRRCVRSISQPRIHGVESASVVAATLTHAGVRTTSGKNS